MAIAVVAAAAGLLVTAGVIVVVVLRNRRRSSDETVHFEESVSALLCDLDAGNVALTGGDRDDTLIRRSVRHGWRAPATHERLDGGRVVIEARPPTGFLAGWWWVDYEIDVPARTTVDVHTAAGRVTVSDVHGDVVVRADAGKVHVQGTRGALQVRTGAGSVQGDALGSPSVEVCTSAGHVRLMFDVAPDVVTARTAAGAVEIRLPDGPYRVGVSSAAGTTRVDVPVDDAARRSIEAHTGAGTVRVSPRSWAAAHAEEVAGLSLVAEPLDAPDAAELISALLAELYDRYGEEDADAPVGSDVAPPGGIFLVARLDGRAVGCGGLRRVDATEAELKRMYVVGDARRLGVGARVLAALEEEARRLGYERLRLETGVRQPEAIALYERAGYSRIANFAPYDDAPLSVCYAKNLSRI